MGLTCASVFCPREKSLTEKEEEEKASDAAAPGLHKSLVQHVQNSLEEAPAVQLSAQCPGVAFTSLGGL